MTGGGICHDICMKEIACSRTEEDEKLICLSISVCNFLPMHHFPIISVNVKEQAPVLNNTINAVIVRLKELVPKSFHLQLVDQVVGCCMGFLYSRRPHQRELAQ